MPPIRAFWRRRAKARIIPDGLLDAPVTDRISTGDWYRQFAEDGDISDRRKLSDYLPAMGRGMGADAIWLYIGLSAISDDGIGDNTQDPPLRQRA